MLMSAKKNSFLFLLLVMVAVISVAQPEVTVKGKGHEILDGAATWPDSTGQSFGVVQANVGAVTKTYWIYNTGTSDLTLSNFRITAVYNTQFSITTPSNLVVSPGDSVFFNVVYAPIAAGTHGRTTGGSGVCVAAFDTDDSDEPTYDFRISGVATSNPAFDCSIGRIFFSHRGGDGKTDLKEWNYGNQPPTRTTINNGWGYGHDGMGLNPIDNYIYAVAYNNSAGNKRRNQLYTFDRSGNAQFVGFISGAGITNNMGQHASAGAFDNNNNLYAFYNQDATSSLRKINVRSQLAESITLSEPVYIRGAIYNPDDGLLYGFSAGATHDGLVSVNPNDGTVTYIGGDGDLTYAAMFRSADGAVYMMSQTYSMYLVDLTNGSIEQIGTNPGWGNGTWVDGCACGEIKAEADVNITVNDNRPSYTPGTTQTYTITVKNNGPWGSYRDTVRNLLPAGVSIMNWTSTTSGTAVSDNASGSGALEDVVDISVGDSIVYTVKIVVPPGFTGNLVNTASVTASTVVADPLMANNFVTDTDVIFSASAEQCNNGFDDDGDGEVDCFDGDCAGVSVCASHYTNGVIPDCPDTPNVALFSMREQWSSSAGEAYVTPAVGDLDSDGIPEIVTVDYTTGRLHVIDGRTGDAIDNIAYENTYNIFSGGAAIADVDNDGTAEIFLVTGNAQSGADNNNARQYITRFDYDNRTLSKTWKQSFGRINVTEYSDQKWAVVQFADFDEDGVTELFIGNHVMSSVTGAIIASPTVAQRNSWPRGRIPPHDPGRPYGDNMSAAYDVLPADSCPNCDGLELVCGNTVYAVDLSDPTDDETGITLATQLTPTATYTDGLTSLADWDGDGQMDIIVTGYRAGSARFYIWDPREDTLIIDETIIPNSGKHPTRQDWGAGRATVADFDGDGVNEFAIVSRHRLNMYEHDGSLKWYSPGYDDSQKTSATAFDFEGDGKTEVIYRDQFWLRIIDGVTGKTKDSLSCTSGTRVEMPVIADVDADGEAEIVISCGGSTVVYTSNQTPWMPTRRVWNSLHYTPTFVNDDLTIPAQRQNKADIPRLDIYAAQAYITDPSGAIVYPALPDFEINIDSTVITDCNDDSMLVYLTVCNDDAAALIYDYPVSFYDGDPNSGGTLLITRTVTMGNSTPTQDSCYQFSFNVPHLPTNLFVFANDSGTGEFGYPTTLLEECDSSNNSANAQVGCPYDAAITKDDGELHYIPGGARTYEIVARNNGPSFTGGIISDPLPSGISAGDVTWTATTYGGAITTASGTMNGALQDTVDIPGGDSIVYSVTISTPDDLTGDLVNVVSINVVGDTITNNNTATDTDTVDCTFAISGVVNSKTQGWTQIGTVVGGFTYNFNSAGGTKTFTASNGPEAGQEITTVVYNTGTGWSISMARNRYNNANSYVETITGTYDNSPHAWTGLSGTAPENAPILGFMAFIDRNGNGSYNSGTDDFIRDINSLTITPDNSGELYMAFYDNGSYADNNGVINIDASIIPPSLDFGEDTTLCAGSTLELDAENPNALSWQWNTGDNTQTIQAESSGEYSVEVTSAGGCIVEDTINVTIDTVIVKLRNDTSFCFGDSLLLDAGNPDAESWNWNTGDDAQTIYIYSTGEYIVDVTNSSGCTSEKDTINITVNALPIIGLGEDTSICSGESILFEGPLGGSSIWSTNEISSSISTDTAGIYYVEHTDTNNCTNSDTVVLTIDTLPDVNLRQDTTLCKGDDLVIDAGPFESWIWNTGENSQIINVDTSGLYKVTVFNTFNCSDSDSVIINLAPLPTIDLGPADTTVCLENLYELDAGNSGETFLWSSGEETQTITPNEAGIYLVTVTLGTGCFAIDSIQIDTFITPLPNLNVPDTAICEGDSVEVSASTGFESYSWTNDTSTSNHAVLKLAGKYFITVISNDGCNGIDSLTLTLNPLPTIGLEDSSKFCSFGQLTLSANEFGAEYAWSTGESDREIIVNTLDTFWVKVTTAENCELSDTTIVYEDTLLIDLGEDASFCEGDSVIIDAGDFVTEIWNSSDTSSTLSVNQSDTITVLAIDSEGCFGIDTMIVTQNPTPSLSLTQQDSAICDLIGETSSASVLNPEDMDIIWSTGESGETTTVSDTGWVKATKTNEFECSAKDSVFVDRECEEKTFTLPNIFTPDDDGTNETFIPIEDPISLSTYFSVIQFIVYNRWGRIVYMSKDKLPYWEGIYQDTGEPCPSGTYFWIVDYRTIYGEPKKLNGYVQLVRKSGT